MPANVAWTWRLPPDNTVLCFAEIWMKTHDAAHVVVTLKSPGGIIFSSTSGPVAPAPGTVIPPYTGVYAPVDGEAARCGCWQSSPPSRPRDRSGTWRLDDRGRVCRHTRQGSSYVARSDPNMGARTGAKRSYFLRMLAGSLPRSFGPLHLRSWRVRQAWFTGSSQGDAHSGIAIGECFEYPRRRQLHPLERPQDTVFIGRSGAGRSSPRRPDFVLPGDESCALEGIRAGGNRSGSVLGSPGPAPGHHSWPA